VNAPTPCTTVTLRIFAIAASPPVSLPTTFSLKPRSFSRSTLVAPGQGGDLDLDVGVGGLELVDHGLQHLGALRARDHLDQLQGRLGLRRQGERRGDDRGQRCSRQRSTHVMPPVAVGVIA
jgi:hypothetical protein